MKELIDRAELLDNGCGKGRVFYLNLPSKFVAGTVYDPVGEGSHHRRNLHADMTRTARRTPSKTDNFGDFWFNGLPDGHSYSLKIEKDAAHEDDRRASARGLDVNLGDIPGAAGVTRLPG